MTVARHTKQWEKYLASTVLVLFSDLLLLLSWFLLLHRRLVLPLLLKVSMRDAVQTHTQYKCVMLNTHTLYTFSTVLIVLLHTTQSVRIGEDIERGNLVITGTRIAACVEAERLTWWSVWRSAAQRLTALCIEPRSVVLVKVDVREVQHLAHWRARLQRMGST